jgi:hypothetical protein
VRLQVQVKDAQEVQRIKEAMVRQAQKKVAALKKKLEDAKQKAKDAAVDLQAVLEGKFPTLPQADFACFARSRC